jgi:hypothetical protein
MNDLYQLQISVIRRLFDLTKDGKISWEMTDGYDDSWQAQISSATLKIEFVYFLRTDEVGSDKVMARIKVFRHLYDYMIGTEGFSLICQMLFTDEYQFNKYKEYHQIVSDIFDKIQNKSSADADDDISNLYKFRF